MFAYLLILINEGRSGGKPYQTQNIIHSRVFLMSYEASVVSSSFLNPSVLDWNQNIMRLRIVSLLPVLF